MAAMPKRCQALSAALHFDATVSDDVERLTRIALAQNLSAFYVLSGAQCASDFEYFGKGELTKQFDTAERTQVLCNVRHPHRVQAAGGDVGRNFEHDCGDVVFAAALVGDEIGRAHV